METKELCKWFAIIPDFSRDLISNNSIPPGKIRVRIGIVQMPASDCVGQ